MGARHFFHPDGDDEDDVEWEDALDENVIKDNPDSDRMLIHRRQRRKLCFDTNNMNTKNISGGLSDDLLSVTRSSMPFTMNINIKLDGNETCKDGTQSDFKRILLSTLQDLSKELRDRHLPLLKVTSSFVVSDGFDYICTYDSAGLIFFVTAVHFYGH